MKKLFGIFITLIGLTISLQGQQSANPFEIVDRLETTEELDVSPTATSIDPNLVEVNDTIIHQSVDSIVLSEDTIETSSIPAIIESIADPNNPFEITERTPKVETESFSDSEIEENSTANSEEVVSTVAPQNANKQTDHFLKNINPAGKADGQQGQFFGLMLLTLVPVTILFMIFRAFFNKAYENILSSTVLNRSYREYAGASIIPMNIWYLVFLLNLGVFVSLIMNYYEVAFTLQPLLNAFICTLIVSVLSVGKRILLAFLGVVFPFRKEMQLYRYLLLLFGIIIGIFLAPINIALIYASDNVLNILMYSSLAFLLVFYLLRSYRALIIGNRFLVLDRFHFLLYICAVEIAPVFILVKLALLYLS